MRNEITYDLTYQAESGPAEDGLRYGMAIVNDQLPGGWFEDYIRFDWRNGLSFERFDKNPVLLKDHMNSVDDAIGMVPSHEITDAGLRIAMDFDMADPTAAAVAGKWDRGYVRGLSIAFMPDVNESRFLIEEDYNGEEVWVYQVDKAELTHIAVVGVPRDPDSLKASLETTFKHEIEAAIANRRRPIASSAAQLREMVANWR